MLKKLLFLLMILIISCTSPQKYFDNQNYQRAYSSALYELKKGKSIKENKSILNGSLKKIIKKEETQILQLTQSDLLKNGKKALWSYKKIQDQLLDANDYLTNELQQKLEELIIADNNLRVKLYDSFYKTGLENLLKTDITSQKKFAQLAYDNFEAAKKYSSFPNLPLDSLINEALEKGIVYFNVTASALFDFEYDWEIDRTFDNIDWKSDRFNSITYEGSGDHFDCELKIEFYSLDIDIRKDTDTKYFETEVIDSYNTVTDSSGVTTQVPVYTTISATVKIITQIKTIAWNARTDVSSYTGNCNISDHHFSSETSTERQVYEFSGDDRAIPDEYKNLMEEDFEDEDDLIKALIEEIYEDISNYYF